MSMIKRKLQELYDDQQFYQQIIEEQIINGKRYVFVEFNQDQRQWQERGDQDESYA